MTQLEPLNEIEENTQLYMNSGSLNRSLLEYIITSPALLHAYMKGEYEQSNSGYFMGTLFDEKLFNPDFNKRYTTIECTTPSSAKQKAFIEHYVENEDPIRAIEYAGYAAKTEATKQRKAKEIIDQYGDYIRHLQEDGDKISYSSDESRILHNMYNNVLSHKVANSILLYPETLDYDTILHQHPLFYTHEGIRCKALPDVICIKETDKTVYIDIYDVKTTSFTFPQFLRKAPYYGYYRQLVWYGLGATKEFISQKPITVRGFLIVAQTKYEYEVRVFKAPKEALKDANLELRKMFDLFKWHSENDKWTHTKEYYEGNGIETIPNYNYSRLSFADTDV